MIMLLLLQGDSTSSVARAESCKLRLWVRNAHRERILFDFLTSSCFLLLLIYISSGRRVRWCSRDWYVHTWKWSHETSLILTLTDCRHRGHTTHRRLDHLLSTTYKTPLTGLSLSPSSLEETQEILFCLLPCHGLQSSRAHQLVRARYFVFPPARFTLHLLERPQRQQQQQQPNTQAALPASPRLWLCCSRCSHPAPWLFCRSGQRWLRLPK